MSQSKAQMDVASSFCLQSRSMQPTHLGFPVPEPREGGAGVARVCYVFNDAN